MTQEDSEIELSLRGLSWEYDDKTYTLIYNLNVPVIKNNVDMCLFNLSPDEPDDTLAVGRNKKFSITKKQCFR